MPTWYREMENTRARGRETECVITVPLGDIIELCACNGDMDKIAGYLFQKDIPREEEEIREDPPELPPRSMRGSCSPVLAKLPGL